MISDLTPEQILAANVDNNPPAQDPDVEAKIAKAVKGQKFSMQLTASQVELMKRFGDVLGLDWQTYLQSQINQKILGSQAVVGGALVTGPSFAQGNRITGTKK
jgi:hypothetical protein